MTLTNKQYMEILKQAREVAGLGNARYVDYAKSIANSIYGTGYRDTDMKQDLEDDIKAHMMNVYGIENPKVTINENNEVTLSIQRNPDNIYWITKVIFNPPATIVFWSDNTKTVVKCCHDENFDEEKGIAMAVVKKFCYECDGGKNSYYNGIKYWLDKAERPYTGAPKSTNDVNKMFYNWGRSVQQAMKKAKENSEFELVCPCCSNKIKFSSKAELLCQGKTKCPMCGLEIVLSEEKTLKPGSKDGIELANKILREMDTLKEEKLCRPENTEK